MDISYILFKLILRTFCEGAVLSVDEFGQGVMRRKRRDWNIKIFKKNSYERKRFEQKEVTKNVQERTKRKDRSDHWIWNRSKVTRLISVLDWFVLVTKAKHLRCIAHFIFTTAWDCYFLHKKKQRPKITQLFRSRAEVLPQDAHLQSLP